MENKASYLLIGSFVLAAFVALFAFVFWLARDGSGGDQSRYYDIYFSESVSGLGIGGEVRYRGIRFGKVVDIRLKDDDPSRVAVRIEVAESPQLREGDRAELSLQGITGVAFVNIAGATANSTSIDPGAGGLGELPSRSSSINQLLKGAPELVASANTVADRLAELLGSDNRNQVNAILQDVNILTSTLSDNAPAVERIVYDIGVTSANLATVSTSVGRLEAKLETLVDRVDSTLGAVENTVQQFDGIADEARSLAARAGDVMDNANVTLASVAGTFKTAGDVVADVGQNTSRLVARADNTLDDVGSALQDAGTAARAMTDLLEDGGDDILGEIRNTTRKLSAAVGDVPAMVSEIRQAAQSFEYLSEQANALVADNTDAIQGLMGDGLNEFYRFIAESRRLVAALTRVSDRLEREGARFLLPQNETDGYVPRGASK